MTRAHYAKAKENRDRYDRISGQIEQAEKLLDQLQPAPQGTTFELRPVGASQVVGMAGKEVLRAALRQFIAGKEEVLLEIEKEFSTL